MLSNESVRQRQVVGHCRPFKDIGFDMCTVWYVKDFGGIQQGHDFNQISKTSPYLCE